ncbi:MAG: hypothetical protein M0D55_18485 [Elusimicrobiota bacterium]|nr:MAG: hypothetical protein M0D55_18485 [Elusimicrobiota bacterium]
MNGNFWLVALLLAAPVARAQDESDAPAGAPAPCSGASRPPTRGPPPRR